MEYIKKQVEDIITKIDECESLVRDQEVVQTKSLKCVIDDMQHQMFREFKEACISIQKYIEDAKAREAAIAAEEQKPIYFDIMQSSGAILPHIKDYVVVGNDKIIRSYNKHNRVVFEDASLAPKCTNYNDLYKLAEEKIKEIISKGRLGLTTKFDTEAEDADYLESEYKKMVDSVELPEDEKLPESFVDDVNRVASQLGKTEEAVKQEEKKAAAKKAPAKGKKSKKNAAKAAK